MMLATLLSLLPCQAEAAQQPASQNVTVPKAKDVVRIMEFNLWQEGTSVAGGFDKIVDVILASQADVVAMSEVRNYKQSDLHDRLVAALAKKGEVFHGRFGGGDVGLISRWPIVKTDIVADSTSLDRGSIIAFYLRHPTGRELVVCSAHLDYRNYAVYLPRGYDGNSFKVIDANGDQEPDPVTDLDTIHAMDKASSRDGWRELYPNPVTHPGATWPSPAWQRDSTSWAAMVDERDRIDFIYHNARGLQAQRAWIVGSPHYYVKNELRAPKTEDAFALAEIAWPSDHKGLLVDFLLIKE